MIIIIIEIVFASRRTVCKLARYTPFLTNSQKSSYTSPGLSDLNDRDYQSFFKLNNVIHLHIQKILILFVNTNAK